MASGTIGVIGVGNMGGAIARGLAANGVASPSDMLLYDADPSKTAAFAKDGFRVSETLYEMGGAVDTVIVAVKPGTVTAALSEISHMKSSVLVLSVAAGVSTAAIESVLPENPVVRVMPNTPCMVGAGASGIARGSKARDEHVRHAIEIMGALGYAVEVPESLMDAVTGLSGSGPAYVAVVIDALMLGGVRMGIPKPVALKLAVQTVYGAAKMIMERGMEPTALRDMVTSPGGTTAEGLMALESSAFRYALMDAVEASAVRSQELGE